MNPDPTIRVAQPDLSGSEQLYAQQAIASSWISSTGPFIDRFEKEFAALCGTENALSVCNGTVALHLALLGLDVRPGDEVLIPALTYVATANAVRYAGGEPVFVDIDPKTWCIDPKLLEDSITRKTKGIIAVHLYGHPADMDEINRIAAMHGLWVIEDAAEAHFATYRGRPVGSLGKIGTFSFYGNKIITCGEGGAVTVSHPHLATRMRMLRGQGADPSRRYYFPVTGHNFRLTNVACAILCAQLERYEKIIERRRDIFSLYKERLQDVPGIEFQPVAPWAVPAPWLFSVTIDPYSFGISRDDLVARLLKEGIETRPFFIPLHILPPFRELQYRTYLHPEVSERIGCRGLNLPTHTGLSDADIDRVCEAIIGARK
jgi:perosamine synthetase